MLRIQSRFCWLLLASVAILVPGCTTLQPAGIIKGAWVVHMLRFHIDPNMWILKEPRQP